MSTIHTRPVKSPSYICGPFLGDVQENVVELIELLVRVLRFGVDWNHHQVLQH